MAGSKDVAVVLPGFGADGYMEKSAIEQFDFNNVDQFISTLGLSQEDIEFRASEFTRVDKADLVGKPLFLIEWESKPSQEFGGLYAVIWAVVQNDDQTTTKVVFADGGTGVAAQLEEETLRREKAGFSDEAQTHAMMVRNGLVRSDYDAHPSKQDPNVLIPAGTTYYLG